MDRITLNAAEKKSLAFSEKEMPDFQRRIWQTVKHSGFQVTEKQYNQLHPYMTKRDIPELPTPPEKEKACYPEQYRGVPIDGAWEYDRYSKLLKDLNIKGAEIL